MAAEFIKEFNIISCKKSTREEKYIIIKTGCDILSQLFLLNMIHIILEIAQYFDWIEVARVSELVTFNLMSCLLPSPKYLRRIFFKNTRYSSTIKNFKYIKLNFPRLCSLSSIDLLYEYHIISRYPVHNIFDSLTLTKKFKKVTDAQFHPTQPLLAVIFDHFYLAIFAYGRNTFFQNRCINTSILYEKSYPNYDIYYGLQWSPKGNYLSFFSTNQHLNIIREWLPKKTLSTPICKDNVASKNIFLLNLNLLTGEVITINDSNTFVTCNWKQSKYIWMNDSTFIFYYQDSIHKVELNSKNKTFTTTTIFSNFKNILSPLEEFTGLMIHPLIKDVLMIVTPCIDLTHFHHCIIFCNIITQTVCNMLSIPGIISNIFLDCFNTNIIVRYFNFRKFKYAVSTVEPPQNQIYWCKLTMPLDYADYQQAKHHYLNDSNSDEHNSIRLQQFRQIDLNSMEYCDLLKPR